MAMGNFNLVTYPSENSGYNTNNSGYIWFYDGIITYYIKYIYIYVYIWLVVEPYPSEKYDSQLGLRHSQDMESHNSHVPNHQPVWEIGGFSLGWWICFSQLRDWDSPVVGGFVFHNWEIGILPWSPGKTFQLQLEGFGHTIPINRGFEQPSISWFIMLYSPIQSFNHHES